MRVFKERVCCRHSSVDSSMLPSRVRVPSTPSTLLSFKVKFVLYLSCERNENKQKEAGFGPFLRKRTSSQNGVHATPRQVYLAQVFTLALISVMPVSSKHLFAHFHVKNGSSSAIILLKANQLFLTTTTATASYQWRLTSLRCSFWTSVQKLGLKWICKLFWDLTWWGCGKRSPVKIITSISMMTSVPKWAVALDRPMMAWMTLAPISCSVSYSNKVILSTRTVLEHNNRTIYPVWYVNITKNITQNYIRKGPTHEYLGKTIGIFALVEDVKMCNQSHLVK